MTKFETDSKILRLQLNQLDQQATALIAAVSLVNQYLNVSNALMAHNEALLKALNERDSNSNTKPDGGSVPRPSQPAAG